MKIGIISGYWNPVHIGHVQMIIDAKEYCDKLIAITNNDKQQLMKKGKIIMNDIDRNFIIFRIKGIDQAYISIDDDKTVCKSIEKIYDIYSNDYSNAEFIFMNGGDRQSVNDIPETEVCNRLGIKMLFGIGGSNKANSSTNINKLTGDE